MNKKDKALYASLRRDMQARRKSILEEFGGKCQVCNLDVKEFLEIHHLLAISKGGNNEFYNLTTLCPVCHKALHIWLDQEDGSDVINQHYRKRISWEQYQNLSKTLSKSIKFRNERAEKIIEYYESKCQRVSK